MLNYNNICNILRLILTLNVTFDHLRIYTFPEDGEVNSETYEATNNNSIISLAYM